MKLTDVEMILAFVCCVIIELTSSQALANNLVQQQQQQPQQTNTSLPALTERTNGLNSRYLSAGSTASLAAATVAAANQTPLQQQQQQQQQQQTSNQQHQSAHQHQNQHPQQAQQQPPQVAPSSSGLHSSQTQLNGLTQQPAQYSTATALQTAPQALASPQMLAGTPVMSSTYAFNPLTGQYGPADSSTFLPGLQQQSLANQQFVSQQSSNNYYPEQQQSPFFQKQSNPFASNGFVVSSGSRLPQRFGGAQHFSQSFYQPSYSQVSGRYPQQSPFLRRNGQQALGIGSRNTNYLLGGSSNGANQLIDDDSNGLLNQQQISSVSLADQLAASLGLNLDPSYVTTSSQQNGGYLQQNNNDQQSGGFLQQQPSSLANSFGTPPGGLIGPSAQSAGNFGASSEQHRGHEQCVAADGRHGTCYQASECIRRGGTPMGRCGASQNLALTNPLGELSGASHVCCLFDVTCGQFAAERFVYFRNPNYPNTFDQSRMCRAKIGKLDKGVCQLRLDLTRFDIAKPTNGNCSQDVFVVSGQNENYVVPKICGLNDGQHYYVGVDESGVITLHMMMMGLYRRSFEILVTQIPCRSDFAAPAHCLQYYMGTHGTIKSFNYDDEIAYGNAPSNGAFVSYDLQQDGSSMAHQLAQTNGGSPPYGLQFSAASNQQLQQRQQPIFGSTQQAVGSNRYGNGADFGSTLLSQFGGYPNDLDYTICIRKESGFCSITYQLSRGEQGLSPFAVGQSLFSGAGAGHNDTSSGWNSVSTECRDDYLLIGGVRLCSGNSQLGSSSLYEQTVQFGNQQSNINNNYSGQQQQLQQQQNSLMQQLSRLQQQQASLVLAANATQSSSGGQQQPGSNTGSGNNNFAAAANLEQQQAAIVQQLMLIQQQMNSLPTSGQLQMTQSQSNGRPFHDNSNQFGQAADQQGAIITDTTSGPFLLRFVSNSARNARGFHIDYRQNPCK